MPWFTPDGCEVQCITDSRYTKGWAITGDAKPDLIKLEPVGPTSHSLGGFPWQSRCGYKITHNEWVLNSSGKQLLWLPHCWRIYETDMLWSGQCLGLLHGELLEAVILEFSE